MDPKVLYWTGALANMLLITALAVRGAGQVKRGEIPAHRRSMLACVALVVAFLVSYALKVVFLGREHLDVWSSLYVNTLRFHETCVLVMVIGGGVALHRARAMRGTRNRTREAADPAAPSAVVSLHHRSGRVAIVALVLAVLSAAVVLFGMYSRL
jgi:uncharacterized membrane protein YozB (DUF420 family)